jgi:LPXTG-site transpeptidase (sortase) family protein
MKIGLKRKLIFVLIFSSIFLVSYVALYFLGLIPDEINPNGGNGISNGVESRIIEKLSNKGDYEKGELPVSISIPSISINSKIINPISTDPGLLDNSLKQGVVRYPGGGVLGKGNLFMFGHSADPKIFSGYLNTFNNLEKLKEGDLIEIESESFIYEYIVESVRLEKASDVYVDFTGEKNMLTLVTCNAFGKKEDRYIVEAVFSNKRTF